MRSCLKWLIIRGGKLLNNAKCWQKWDRALVLNLGWFFPPWGPLVVWEDIFFVTTTEGESTVGI